MAAALLKKFEPEIESLTLIPSDGGRFEISVNQKLLYSKLQTGQHVAPEAVEKLVENYLRERH